MNVTPKNMARQITVAAQQRVERERVARVAPRTRLAFRSETGVVRPVRPEIAPTMAEMEEDPFCFVCGRNTDHWGEHDDMVGAGTARYEDNGNVYPVPWGYDV